MSSISNNTQKIYTYLGFAARSRTAKAGEQSALAHLKKNDVFLLIIAENAQPKSIDRWQRRAEQYHVPYIMFGSQEELGKMLHVSKVSICGYEKGTKNPTLDNFEKLLKILSLEPNDLLYTEDSLVKEDILPYEGISNNDICLIKALKKHRKLYKILCQNIDNLDKIEIK